MAPLHTQRRRGRRSGGGPTPAGGGRARQLAGWSRWLLLLTLACTAHTPVRTHAPAPAWGPLSIFRGMPPVPVRPLPEAFRPPAGAQEASGRRVVLAAVGDILLQGQVQASAEASAEEEREGYAGLFAPVADELEGPDLLFANLESPVAPKDGEVRTGAFSFNAPPAALHALRGAGLDVVSVANNHIFDRGRRGFTETLANLEAEGLAHVGAGPAPREAGPRILEVGGMRVAFLAWTQLLNRDFNACSEPDCPAVAVLRQWEPAEEAVRAAAAQADAVVVSLHWGREYEPQPGPGEEQLARRLCEAGALLVLGHHPHVLQPLELYRRQDGGVSLIAYSLGNFISNQARSYLPGVFPAAQGDPRDGALLRVELAQRAGGGAELAGADVLPLWTENERAPVGAPAIRVVALERALAEVREALAPALALPDGERRLLERRQRLYLERLARIRARVGEGFVRGPRGLPAEPRVVGR